MGKQPKLRVNLHINERQKSTLASCLHSVFEFFDEVDHGIHHLKFRKTGVEHERRICECAKK